MLSGFGSAMALGVANVPQVPGTLLSGPNAPEAGRTAVIAYHGGMLITFPEAPGSPPGDYQVRAWDIADPTNPAVTQVLGHTQHGFLAHGFIKHDQVVSSGYTFDVDAAGIVTEDSLDFPQLGWSHSGMSRPWGVTDFWSYGDTSQPASIFLDNHYDRPADAVFDPVGMTGVVGHAFILGTYMFYASDQSRTGIASWDVSDPSNPVLLDVLTDGSVGGYWPDPVGVNGNLYFFFPRNEPEGGYQIVDATDPTDLKLVADVPVEGNPNYAQFQDEFAFTERYKIDMRTFQIVLELDEDADSRPGDPIDTSQFSLPVGNLWISGGLYKGGTCSVPGFGTHCGTGMSIWAHQADPDTRGPFVGYHQPADGASNFPVTHSIQVLVHETLQSETINSSTVRLRPIIGGTPGAQVPARYFFASNDILSIVPDDDLADNTTYEVEFVEGGILDAVGNGMQPYSFRFSTGSSVAGGNQRPVINSFTSDTNPVSPGGTAGFSASATDPDSDPLEYRFDFGDGQSTDWQSNAFSSHTYNAEGHFTALLQVRDDSGSIASRSLGVTVVDQVSGLGGTSSAPLALGSDRRLWVVNPDNDTVSIFNADSRTREREVRTCADPRSVTIDASNRAWIACHDADQILILNPNGSRAGVIPTGYGSAPFSVAFNPSLNRVLATLHGSGEVMLMNPASLAEIQRIATGPTPRAIAWTSSGNRALVTRFVSPQEQGEVWDLAVSAASLSLTDTITFQHQWGVDDRTDGRGVPNYLSSIAITPDGQHAWVTAKKDNSTRGTYFSGINLDQDNTVRAIMMRIDLSTGEEDFDVRSDLDNGEQPSAISYSTWGDYAFVTLQGNNAVLVVDMLKIENGFSGASSVVSRVGVGLAPQGVVYDSATERLWVQDFMDRTASVLDLSTFNSGGGPTFQVQTLDKTDNEVLTATELLGKQVFYNASDLRMSGEGYMSCASCHIDGGHDGRTFDFTDRGEGIRNTTSLRGRSGMAHGLVHWSANFDEIQDFEHDIRGAFGGTGFLSDAQFNSADTPLGNPKAGMNAELDALAEYVSSLDRQTVPRSPHRSGNGALTPAATQGATVFSNNGCASCHSGVDFTANTTLTPNLQDVGSVGTASGQRLGGTLTGIDTPTLNGIWNTAPYLHSGAADDLESVFLLTGGQTWQAETGSISGNAEMRDGEHWSIAGLAVVREGNFVALETGSSVSLNVDGDGGPAILRLRYHANYGDASLTITINGQAQSVTAPETLFFWQYLNWEFLDLPVTLNSGTNTVVVQYNSGGGFALDEITVTETNSLISAAMEHMQVNNLAAVDRNNLLAYLLQLDARPGNARTVSIDQPGAQVLAGNVEIMGAATGSAGGQVMVAINDGAFQNASGSTGWSFLWDTTSVGNGFHVVTARYIDPVTETWVESQREYEVDQLNGTGGELVFRDGFEN